MADGVTGSLTLAGSSRGQKIKGETPTRVGISSMVSHPLSRRVCKPFERCCSCTRQSTCSTAGLSAQSCKCRNASRQCTGCYCWVWCNNMAQLMPPLTTAKFLLGHFLRGANPPATDQHASPPHLRSPAYFSIWAILAAEARGRGVVGRESGHTSLMEGRGDGAGAGGRTRDGKGRRATQQGQQ